MEVEWFNSRLLTMKREWVSE